MYGWTTWKASSLPSVSLHTYILKINCFFCSTYIKVLYVSPSMYKYSLGYKVIPTIFCSKCIILAANFLLCLHFFVKNQKTYLGIPPSILKASNLFFIKHNTCTFCEIQLCMKKNNIIMKYHSGNYLQRHIFYSMSIFCWCQLIIYVVHMQLFINILNRICFLF